VTLSDSTTAASSKAVKTAYDKAVDAYGKATTTATVTVAGIVKADVAATPGTVVLRGADGRAQVSPPAAAGDIATMGYVDEAVEGATRKRVLGLTLYLRPDGDNGNSGLADTPEEALIDFAGVMNVMAGYDLQGGTLTIMIGAGTYTDREFTVLRGVGFVGVRYIQVIGSGENTTIINDTRSRSVIISYSLPGARMNIGNLTIRGVYGNFLESRENATIYITGPITFESLAADNGSTAALYAVGGGNIQVYSSSYQITIKGKWSYIFRSDYNSAMTLGDVTYNGSVTCGANAYCGRRSYLDLSHTQFSGSVTGKRYTVSTLSLLLTNGSGANFIPGTTAGTTASGGLYV
jgi:hypothetical protein